MTSYEILKANVLDIIFENRNKAYGAYELRTHYKQRMGIALGVMLSTVFLLALLIGSNSEKIKQVVEGIAEPVIVTVRPFVEPPPIEQPVVAPAPAARPNIAQEKFNNVEIVSDTYETDFPDHNQLQKAAISGVHSDGDEFLDAKQPALQGVEKGDGTVPERIEEKGFERVEKNATFPGGPHAWLEFLKRHLRTPDELDAGQKRTVLMRFAVGADGLISHFEIVQSGGAAFDKEVIRVLKKMPKWEPAVQNGNHVSVMFTQPVTFMAFEE